MKSVPENSFIVEGFSVIKEYLRYKKEDIIEIVYKEKYKTQVLSLTKGITVKLRMEEEKAPHEVSKKIVKTDGKTSFSSKLKDKKNGDISNFNSQEKISSPVWALVKASYTDEIDFFQHIKNKNNDVIVALDHITDSHNLGSIARSSAFFGINHLLLPKARQAHFSRGAFTTSQGAFALCHLVLVSNLVQTLEKLKEQGYWIIATDMNAPSFEKIAGFYEKVVLVFGAEDHGVSELVKKRSDCVVSIKGVEGGLESLNVGVAAGILIQSFSSSARNENKK